MSEEMMDYFSLLVFKNQLLCMSDDQLTEFYKDERCFLEFLDAVALISRNEPGFFVISDEIVRRIFMIINQHRFSCDDAVKDYINEVVIYLNSISNLSSEMADMLFTAYKKYQEEVREGEFTSNEAFLCSLAHDAVLFGALYDDKLDNLKDGDLSLLSLNYIVNTCPEFFEDDNIKSRALNLLNIENKNSKIFSKRKKVVKSIRNSLINI